mgnify:CR=1 FL=1
MEKISIIIPIYNAEKYLYQCLNSIKEQTYTNIEVLMINDGSTDNSETICKEFLNDSRFCLINKKNGGVSSARNLGINRCNGEYVLFVDSDDWCHKELLKQAVQNIKSYDMLCFAYYKAYKNKNIYEELKVNENANIRDEILINKLIGGYLWNKLFSTNIIKEHGIKFNESITYCEDLIFIIQYIKYVKKVNYINKALYYYRVRKNSVSNDFYNNKNISILNAYELLINEYNECDFFVSNLKFSYLLNYYKLRKFIPKEYNVNLDIVAEEKKFLANKSIKQKIKFNLIKYFPKVFIRLKDMKNGKMNLYD